MAELLAAIEENREPSNNGRDNLLSLALAFRRNRLLADGHGRALLASASSRRR
jgi:hypothetical protein